MAPLVYHAAGKLCQKPCWTGFDLDKRELAFMGAGNWRKIAITFYLGFFVLAAVWPGASLEAYPTFRSAIPAGYEVVQLQPSGALLSLLALVECPEIEGAHRTSDGLNAEVISAGGLPLRQFPRHFSYRVTASLRKTIIDSPSFRVITQADPERVLLQLKFKLRGYNGLEAEQIPIESVSLIGVPADVPYDERVYRVSFDVGDRPVTERFVLEVLSPGGERLARFHFELL
jgi:hypothetical protein